ncbi:MAG: type II/IV secretion system protein [Gammaproteobacteria bacterium]|nr:type II/IV secretion system protein [Gammaproteobacteria bacterium]
MQAGGAPIAELEKLTGRRTDELLPALAALLTFRYVPGAELLRLSPAFDLLGPADAARRGCLLVREGTRLLAVHSDPFDPTLRGWLEARVPQVMEWALAQRADISSSIGRHEQSLRALDEEVVSTGAAAGREGEPEALTLASIRRDGSPIVRLVHSTVFDALRAGASDVHIESCQSGLVVRYRIDGVLLQMGTVKGSDVAEQVLSRIKVMSELDIAERRVPQDGRFRISYEGRMIDFRVSIIPSVFGEDAVLRVLDKQAITDRVTGLKLSALGFDPRVVSKLLRLASRPHGMLLVTGPTGSGKTTTLYAAISETNNGQDKIVTIEDPVEYQLPGVLQIPVNEKKGLTFAKGLRSILRHDPDKIMVGEIRDPETAQIAIQSALTGHLVFTTVHANSVFDVLSRFAHMGVDPYSFTSALNGILAQRLVRIVCSQCAEAHPPTREQLEESGIPLAYAAAFHFRIGRGCQHCRGSGYRGRKAVGELLVLNDELREAIIARAPVRQLKEMALKAGSRFLRSAAVDLVRRGETTIEEVNRVTAMA